MKIRFLFLLIAMIGMILQGKGQSVAETADRIGMVGFWKMMEMHGRSDGENISQNLDGSNFFIFNKNGTCQYSTNERKIANGKWTLKGKELHIWGNDKVNDPDGIDYTFELVMVTPEELVVKLGDDEEYIYTTFHKSKATLKPVGSSTKKRSQTRRR